MGAVVDRGKGKIEIIYGGLESPFVGIDSSKSSGAFITPNALAKSGGLAPVDGYLCSQFLNFRAATTQAAAAGDFNTFLVGDVAVFNISTGPPSNIVRGSYLYIIYYDVGSTTLKLIEYRNGLAAGPTGTLSIAAPKPSTLTSYTVNGVVYITGLGFGAIYSYTPVPSGTSQLALVTNYLGAAYLGELNGRLIALAVDQYISGTYFYFPFQMAWSAALGAYSIWNPLVGGLVTGAGFNNLPDVEDEITGFITTGPTGYIIRKQGITEVTPLNSGIQPFDWNHLWASHKGIGSIYPRTITQYGSAGSFLSDTGYYTLGYDGVNSIQGNFWDTITSTLKAYQSTPGLSLNQLYSNIVAIMTPITLAGNTFLATILYIPGAVDAVGTPVFFVGNVLTKDWTTVQYTTFGPSYSFQVINNLALLGSGLDQAIASVATATFNGTVWSIDIATIDDTYMASTPSTNQNINVSFPVEEVVMFKDVTVNAIAFYLDATNNTTLTISPTVNGVTYTPFSPVGFGLFFVSYPVTLGFCAKYPQLSLEITIDDVEVAQLKIYKITMFCTIDQTQVP